MKICPLNFLTLSYLPLSATDNSGGTLPFHLIPPGERMEKRYSITASFPSPGLGWFDTSSLALNRHQVDASKLAIWHNTLTPHIRITDDCEIAFGLN